MLFVNFLKKNAEAGQAFFKKLLLVGYTLGLWNAMLGDNHLILRMGGGGGGWTDNFFSLWARPGNFFSCGMGSGKFILFSCKPGITTVHCTEANYYLDSNAIESSRIMWNYNVL